MKRFGNFVYAAATAFLFFQAGCHHEYSRELPEHPALTHTANVGLPHIFGDHMVLQAHMRVPVWGSAEPNERVTVHFMGQEMATSADSQGQWQLALHSMDDSGEGKAMVVSGDHGDVLQLNDVLVGEVWLGSGQSNMEFMVKQGQRAKEFIAAAHDPEIRIFTVKRKMSDSPESDVDGMWQVCTPETLPTFSAVLYHFGLNLHKKLDVPMGLIASSWGGTPLQAWTPSDAFTPAEVSDLKQDAAAHPRFPGGPSVLYNGMIAPIAGYAMRGAIWYQGEADNRPGKVENYGERLHAMVEEWRDAWREGSFPFYIVEIAPYNYGKDDTLPILWQQQIWFVHHTHHAGIAGTGDIGNIKNIHPTNKHEVGRRLSLLALNMTYGWHDVPDMSPVFYNYEISGNQIRIHFDHTYGDLKTCDGNEPKWFEIAGADKRFVPAQARIEGEDVLVWSDKISDPRYVRLGGTQVAQINLCNSADLPALPFDMSQQLYPGDRAEE